jgi:hypothetical protein
MYFNFTGFRQRNILYRHLSHSLSFPLLPLWSIGHPWNTLFHFRFLILGQSVGLLGRGISLSQGRYLHMATQTQNKRWHSCLGWAIRAFERAKTFHALDRSPTVIGCLDILHVKYLLHVWIVWPLSCIVHSLYFPYFSNSLFINKPVTRQCIFWAHGTA